MFIRATLSDNPDLARTNYASVLASLPEGLRRAYRDGDFSVGIRDADSQVIPTAWVLAAEGTLEAGRGAWARNDSDGSRSCRRRTGQRRTRTTAWRLVCRTHLSQGARDGRRLHD